jgi:ribosomal RNA assembly protein
MKKIISDKIARILKNKNNLEEELNIKISVKGEEVEIDGEPEDEYIAEQVIDAINMGFPYSTAFLIKKEDYFFEILNIKDYTTKKDLKSVRARIIGKNGKTLKVLADLSGCFFELKDNSVGIIGNPELIRPAQDALISLIRGAKQANVYTGLEKNRPEPIEDLGLKPVKNKKE